MKQSEKHFLICQLMDRLLSNATGHSLSKKAQVRLRKASLKEKLDVRNNDFHIIIPKQTIDVKKLLDMAYRI